MNVPTASYSTSNVADDLVPNITNIIINAEHYHRPISFRRVKVSSLVRFHSVQVLGIVKFPFVRFLVKY